MMEYFYGAKVTFINYTVLIVYKTSKHVNIDLCIYSLVVKNLNEYKYYCWAAVTL